MRRFTHILIALPMVALALTGCRSADGPTSVALEPGQYARAFDETKDILASRQFTLERVDARAGVITTRPKATAGLATPWDTEQSSLAQEFEDVMNQQERRVRVTFVRAAEQDSDSVGGLETSRPSDLRLESGSLEARFEVTLLRVSVPGTRVESSVIRMSSRTRDPELTSRGVGGRDRIAIATDEALAARLAQALQDRLGNQTADASDP